MTDEQGRPMVEAYYDTEGMTTEAVEAMDQRILTVAGDWRSLQFGIDTRRRFTWSCETLAEATALCAHLKAAGFAASESITGARTK